MQPAAQPESSIVFGGEPCPLLDNASCNILETVEMKRVVELSWVVNWTPVTGSSDSYTMRCLVPRSWTRSPRMTVTAPFAKPTAICVRSSSAAKADIYMPQVNTQHLLALLRTTHRKLPPPVVNRQSAEAGRHVGPLNQLVQSPSLERRLAAHVLLSTSQRKPSKTPYEDGSPQSSPAGSSPPPDACV